MDKEQAKDVFNIKASGHLANKYANKALRRYAKTGDKNDAKYNKYLEKTKKHVALEKFSRERLAAGERETNKLIAEASKAGYTVTIKKRQRDVFAGERFSAQFWGGIPGNLALSTAIRVSTGDWGIVEGNQFKVKKTKNFSGEVKNVRTVKTKRGMIITPVN